MLLVAENMPPTSEFVPLIGQLSLFAIYFFYIIERNVLSKNLTKSFLGKSSAENGKKKWGKSDVVTAKVRK